jgi:valyl-tRNA synthetase
VANSIPFLIGREKFFVALQQDIDAGAECDRLKKEMEYYQGFMAGVRKKLDNERFVSSAPANVVEMERKKLADSEAKLRNIQEELTKLGCA